MIITTRKWKYFGVFPFDVIRTQKNPNIITNFCSKFFSDDDLATCFQLETSFMSSRLLAR